MNEFVKLREARRAMDQARPQINNAWVSARELLRLFFFDPYDPEWSCDSKRKVGIAKYVAWMMRSAAAVGGNVGSLLQLAVAAVVCRCDPASCSLSHVRTRVCGQGEWKRWSKVDVWCTAAQEAVCHLQPRLQQRH